MEGKVIRYQQNPMWRQFTHRRKRGGDDGAARDADRRWDRVLDDPL